MYIYIYTNCTVNIGLAVSEKSTFITGFGRFQGNLFPLGKHKWFLKNISGYRRF